MKVVLCYKEFELGELAKEENEYVFTPVSGCELAKQRYILPRASHLLSGGVKRDKELFPEYREFFKLLKNNYIKCEAGIIDADTDFEKLIKIARLDLSRSSFYLKNRK